MSLYELLYIVPAKYAEDELGPVQNQIKKILEKYGAKITKSENLGKKKLAYPIKKFYQGYYLLNEFEAEGKNINELNNTLRLTDEIIRHIIVKDPPHMEIKQPMAPVAVGKKKIEVPRVAEETAETAQIKKEEEKDKIKLEDLDKKLDEILDTDNLL